MPFRNLQFFLKWGCGFICAFLFIRCKRAPFCFMSQISCRFESDLRQLMMGRMESSFITNCLFSCIVIKCLYTSLKETFQTALLFFTVIAGTLAINSSIHNNREHISPVFISWSLASTQTGTYRKLLWQLKYDWQFILWACSDKGGMLQTNKPLGWYRDWENSQQHSSYSITCSQVMSMTGSKLLIKARSYTAVEYDAVSTPA